MRKLRIPLLVVSITALGLGTAQPAAAATLRADYRFQDTLTSSVGSAPALEPIGAGTGFATEIVQGDQQRVFTWPTGNGLLLPNAVSILPNGTDQYTIAVLFRLDEVGDSPGDDYRRIINLKDAGEDEGLYLEEGDLVYYEQSAEADTNVVDDQYVHVVLTRDGNDTVRGYLDGVLGFSFADSTDAASSAGEIRFMVDNVDEESSGAVARLRVWDDALSEPEVAMLGPGNACPGAPAGNHIAGTEGDDVLLGTAGADVICGLGGNDTLVGDAGDDLLLGGPGNDSLDGGVGDDQASGEAGNDRSVGGDGEDALAGGGGKDRLKGQGDDDLLKGQGGNDRLSGGPGDDRCNPGAGKKDRVRSCE